jgi:hypothetical protein
MEGSKLPIDYGVKAHSELSMKGITGIFPQTSERGRGIKVRILINQQKIELYLQVPVPLT